jgi:hypothetical protein
MRTLCAEHHDSIHRTIGAVGGCGVQSHARGSARGSPWSLLCVSLWASTPEDALGGPAQLKRVSFFFLLFPISVNFEILGELKKALIRKFYFEKLFRLKLVQFEICSISNFMFKFEKYV